MRCIEEQECRGTDVIDWLKERQPDWQNMRSIAAITAKRIAKKTGQTSVEARFEMTPFAAGPAAIRTAARGGSKTICTGS